MSGESMDARIRQAVGRRPSRTEQPPARSSHGSADGGARPMPPAPEPTTPTDRLRATLDQRRAEIAEGAAHHAWLRIDHHERSKP